MIKILIPVDGSECALAAVRHAGFLFAEGGISEVLLFNVQPALETGRAAAFHSRAELRDLEIREGTLALQEASRILSDAGASYSIMIGTGAPAKTIVAAALSAGCDGVVIGASLWTQIKARFGGGLPAQVMRCTSVPVTVVKSVRASKRAGHPLAEPVHTLPSPNMVPILE